MAEDVSCLCGCLWCSSTPARFTGTALSWHLQVLSTCVYIYNIMFTSFLLEVKTREVEVFLGRSGCPDVLAEREAPDKYIPQAISGGELPGMMVE